MTIDHALKAAPGPATAYDAPPPPEYVGMNLDDGTAAGELLRRDARQLLDRLVEHYRANTTDQADEQWSEPVRNYHDEDLWRRELAAIHRRVPLPLALSCEIPTPGSYKAIEVAGIPVVITRGDDGRVYASVNACRHRGAQIVPEGTGTTKRLTCPYHSWTYDLKGCLIGVYGEKTFGPVDRDRMGLLRLPADERAGIVFVSLDRSAELDLDSWLGDMQPLLAGLGLAGVHHHSTKELSGPNWKVTLDGYLEGYHFASLHRTTVFKTNFSNMATFESWGQHQRLAFALRPIAEAVKLPPEQRDPTTCVGPIFWLFPGMAIAGGWRDRAAVSIVLPGRTMGESVTQQILVLRQPPADDEAIKAADMTSEWFYKVVLDEDYATGYAVQRGLDGLDGADFLFGRNEPGVQHFHRSVNRLLEVEAERGRT